MREKELIPVWTTVSMFGAHRLTKEEVLIPHSSKKIPCKRKLLCMIAAAFTLGLTIGALCMRKSGVVVIARQGGIVEDGVFWSSALEEKLPKGFTSKEYEDWEKYVDKASGVRLEKGCGRMQNRLVTFEDGSQGCVRYRQNTDQIQGELFSFYLAQVLNIHNLAPSTVTVVNLDTPLFKNIITEVATAQWNTNRPVVITKYIKNLDSSSIPKIFRPNERHLNVHDLKNYTLNNTKHLETLTELAQWSDLIVFDYLTANLDRIVNNLYNYQWNTNIMSAPAHNLAKQTPTNLLLFLDNESGLLHGYRLLDKYETYHSVLLDNLCVFRRTTVDAVRKLSRDGDAGEVLRRVFAERSGAAADVLPTLPDKSARILAERVRRVEQQVDRCLAMYGDANDER